MGSMFFLNKLHDFHKSECSASPTSASFEHDPLCSNVGMLHKEHSLSQYSLWLKSQNSFLKASSLKFSTTTFTIFSLFSSLIDNSRNPSQVALISSLFFALIIDILLEELFITPQVGYGGYRNFRKLTWKSTFINYKFLYYTLILLLLKQFFYTFPN